MRLLLGVLLLCAIPVWSDVFEPAQWLRDPRMQGQPVRDFYDRKAKANPGGEGPWNQHTLFRKEIFLREAPAQALLWISGDDYYKFSINGNQVVQGPEPGYPFAHPYYVVDITPSLQQGRNVLASHSYYQGLVNRVWNSGDNRSGFICRIEVTHEDESREQFVSDASWRCLPLEAFGGTDTFGYSTQFVEHIDMRLMPTGWERPGFDDSSWQPPLVERQDHVFTRQLTPPLDLYRVDPVVSKPLGDGRYYYDFGRMVVGTARVKVQGPAGHKLTVRLGEELEGPDQVRYALRAGCVYEDFPILSGGMDTIEFYDYRGFRYMEILDAPGPPEVWVQAQHHPYPKARSSFSSTDTQLEAIWELCRHTTQISTQGVFVDCPTREKGQYLGDTLIASRAHLWLTGDPTATKKALADFQYSRQIHPGLMSVAPGNILQEFAEYSLQYPLMLQTYYRHTGDRSFTDLMVSAVYPGLFRHFRKFENKEGLLENYTEKVILIDWPPNMRDDFDGGSINTVLNAFYYGALRSAEALMQDLGREFLLYRQAADRLEESFGRRLADPATGLYVDSAGSTHSSLHANAVPLAFGLTNGADPANMLELIRQKRLSCGLYMASFVIEAAFRGGDAALGYDLITSDDTNSWNQMLRNGATAATETWIPEQKRNMSWIHPWGTSPIYLLSEHVFGLTPAAPGWKRISFTPPAIPDLPQMELLAPHPQGRMRVRHVPGEGFTLTVPEGVEVITAARGVPIVVQEEQGRGSAMFSDLQRQYLTAQGWSQQVGSGLGVWIDVDTQMLYLLRDLVPVWQAPVGTASAGTGSEAGSYRTPLGWHTVSEKFGAGAPWGQVFRARGATSQVWRPGQDTVEDLVLTRILWLDGLEPGQNKGRNAQGVSVDSKARCIYIHGTNGEQLIGTPSSHGCIRLLNDDVITAFDLIPVGTPVLITEQG